MRIILIVALVATNLFFIGSSTAAANTASTTASTSPVVPTSTPPVATSTASTTSTISPTIQAAAVATVSSPIELTIDGQLVVDGGTVTVTNPISTSVQISWTGRAFDYAHTLVRHDSTGDVTIPFMLASPDEPTAAQWNAYLLEYFGAGTDVTMYEYALATGDESKLSSSELSSFYDFYDWYSARYDYPSYPALGPGDYTLASTEVCPILSMRKPSLWEQVRTFFIPTVYAQFGCPFDTTYVLSFTIIYLPTPVLTGSGSSIMFLPGIMGSRLFEVSDTCASSVAEQERWFSLSTCDQLRLEADDSGNSVNDIYTKAEEASIVDEVLIQNLYKTFLRDLADWKADGSIADYAAVPYDWRLSLDQILRATRDPSTDEIRFHTSDTLTDGYLYETLAQLAAGSQTGKVTIVTHSNGGLVAKAFLAALEAANDPLLNTIDNLILVAVPQTGTPEAVLNLLHGSGLGPASLVVSNETARTLAQNMPFAYNLLPSEAYFDTVSTPVITFEAGSSTDAWVQQYGTGIGDTLSLSAFLTDGTRTQPVAADLTTPEIATGLLLDGAETTHATLDTWTAPATIAVHQIAGTGIDTVVGVEYFNDIDCIFPRLLQKLLCSSRPTKLGFRPVKAIDGDETVVISSAITDFSVNQYWLNLLEYGQDGFLGTNKNRVHRDIFEVPDVSNFVFNTALATTSKSYTYLATTAPDFSGETRLSFTLHSPLDLQVQQGSGVVSSSSVTVSGAQYRRFGEVQHITLPDTGTPVTVQLIGQALGSFTLDSEVWQGNALAERVTYAGLPTATGTLATLVVQSADDIASSFLMVDYDHDGTDDFTVAARGYIFYNPQEEPKEEKPEKEKPKPKKDKHKKHGTKVKRPEPSVAGVSTYHNPRDEYYAQLMVLLQQLNFLLEKVYNKETHA